MSKTLRVHFERLIEQRELSRHLDQYKDKIDGKKIISSYDDYLEAVNALIRMGNSNQKFQYLFYQYAQTYNDGITRNELLILLQDNLNPSVLDKDLRFFEKVYTYLKRHFTALRASFEDVITLLTQHPNLDILGSIAINQEKLQSLLEVNNTKNAIPDVLKSS
ncbi:hypothetical protein THRCLA_11984 [Thraustotheca clavata]|uniref:Uncharacterized protein n=1 Tax=Thraustotheca clavata TaxID=74557 RepID=A0A1V9Y4D6_9STRA|nr:hypothetical protein THRCLA_11984 [Thraustotheca clavata]